MRVNFIWSRLACLILKLCVLPESFQDFLGSIVLGNFKFICEHFLDLFNKAWIEFVLFNVPSVSTIRVLANIHLIFQFIQILVNASEIFEEKIPGLLNGM